MRLLAAEAGRCGWEVLTYCQMTNHIHLLLRTPEPNLGEGLKAAHEAFANFVNKKYDEHGHVFGHRFKNKLVRDDPHLFGCFRYIARNPTEAGLCRTVGEWPWSAHAALAGQQPPTPLLDLDAALAFFHEEREIAYGEYLRSAMADDWDLLTTLMRRRPRGWLVSAVEDYRVPIAVTAEYLGITERSVYRRLRKERRVTEGPGP